MKKTGSILLIAILATGLLSACSFERPAVSPDSDKLQIVTTIFPEYDWVLQILGENPANADVTLLLDNGVDLHSYQPTASDILKISNCDLFVYIGGESDEWVEDAMKEAVNKDMIVLNLLKLLGSSAKEETLLPGMQEEEEEASSEEPEFDEHVWLSLKNASDLVPKIAEALEKADPSNANVYRKNAESYLEQLTALDEAYQDAVSNGSRNTLVFGDRFPFRYLADDYGLDCFAAFSGCSAETEASFETVTFLARKIDELKLPAIMTIEGTDHKIAETIIQNTTSKNQKVLPLDSMQSTTSRDVKNGSTYLSIMERNLAVLKEAL